MKQIVFPILLTVVLAGCHFGSQKSVNPGEPVEINLSEDYPSKEIHLQNIADIEYIPLETTKDILVGGNSKVSYVSDKYILVWDRQGDIFVFGRNGKAVTHFNRMGRGDKEYPGISSVMFDEAAEEIFVFNNFVSSRILVYSLSGDYRRTLNISEDIVKMTAYNFDSETMLVYDESGLVQNKYSENPYMFLSKKDGSAVSSLNIKLPVRYSATVYNRFKDANGQQMTRPFMIATPNNRHYGRDFVIADISSDTIYRLTENKDLTPLFVRTPSVHSSEPRVVWTSQLATDKFILLWRITLDFIALEKTQTVSYINLIYDYETGEINRVSFINDDFPSKTWIIDVADLDIAKNMTAELIDITTLKDAYDEKKLKGDLERLTATLDEENNPIVMITKFK